MGVPKNTEPLPYFMGSTAAALINFPLWRVSAIGQSGFKYKDPSPSMFKMYMEAIKPPYKGASLVVAGMTWARGAIFFGSDRGRVYLKERGFNATVSSALPPLIIATFVQCTNQPIVRGSITLQDPQKSYKNAFEVLRIVRQKHGFWAMWHGVSAGILKSVPKYCTAIMAKDYLEYKLPPSDGSKQGELRRSAIKSVLAGITGATITNPFDVIRNEMFKTNESLVHTVNRLFKEEPGFVSRGLLKNIVAVSIPIATTIFLTDVFATYMFPR
eukprot:m.67022 g.67022  ORF g.67022 m.67022 type:complete len:271 (-) comp11852_c0_seq3:65-877(-)